jgi:hypothetical protein
MRRDNVTPHEMSNFFNISDSELEEISAGQIGSEDDRLGDVAQFVDDLKGAFPEAPIDHCEAANVAAMMQAAHLMADKGEPVARPASKADGSAEQTSGLPNPGRVPMYKQILATRGAKLATITTALLLAFSGVAIAGGLPDPVQDAVANTAEQVGINLPGGDDEAATPVIEATELEVDDDDAVDEGVAEDAEDAAEDAAEAADDQGEDADDQGEDADDDAEDAEHDAIHESDDDDDEDKATVHESDDEDDGDEDSSSVEQDNDDDEDEGAGSADESSDSDDAPDDGDVEAEDD